MTAKVIQGSFLGGQPKRPSSIQPKIAPSPFQVRTAAGFARGAQPIQRHGMGNPFAVEAGPLGLMSSGGRPLPEAVRGKMEAALGADFSGVRVHVGPQAERIGAIAFTIGADIYFAPGRYRPDTIQGQQLLGHELAHVVQQRQGRVRNPLGTGIAVVQDYALEAEADRLGQRAATHRAGVQAKMVPAVAPPSLPVRISPPAGAGPGSYRLTAGAGGREIGSVMVHARNRGAVEITDLGVDPAHREHGIGRMLVASAARVGLQSGKSKVTLAAQDNGSGRLTQWYRGMGFVQTGINQRGYPQLEAPVSRVLAGTAQRQEAPRARLDPAQLSRGQLSRGQLSRGMSAVVQGHQHLPFASPLRTAWENSTRALRYPQVVQRMEWFETTAVKAMSWGAGFMKMFKPNPNPFEMEAFTFCICLVFNYAGLEECNNYKSGFGRVAIFESIKDAWESHHKSGTFVDVCPFGNENHPTEEYLGLIHKIMSDPSITGDNPLIVIVGHCSAGSAVISNDFKDEKKRDFKISEVIDSINPILKKHSTIYLTPCSTGKGESSFQTQFTNELASNWNRPELDNSDILIIGTLSTTMPGMGGVYSEGETYSRVKIRNDEHKSGAISTDRFLASTGHISIACKGKRDVGASIDLEKIAPGYRGIIVKIVEYDAMENKTKCWVQKVHK